MSGTAPRRLRQAAACIAAVGLVLAGLAYLRAGRAQDPPAGGYQIVGGAAYAVEESPAALAQTERMGGQALVMTTRFSRWLGSLWHGERLAWTIGGLAVLTALICLWLAGLADETDADQPR